MRKNKLGRAVILLVASISINTLGQAGDGIPIRVVNTATNSFHEYDFTNTFDDVIDAGPQVPHAVALTHSFSPYEGGGVNYPGQPSYIAGLVQKSDFVGFGVPVRVWTYVIKGNFFTTSIYLVHVNSLVIGRKEPIVSGTDIFITKAGGTTTYRGHEVRGEDLDSPPLEINKEYMFFGKHLIDGLYKVDSDGVLSVGGDTLMETSTAQIHAAAFKGRDRRSIFSEALAASQSSVRGAKGFHNDARTSCSR